MATAFAMVVAFLGGCVVAGLAIVVRGKVDLARIHLETELRRRD